MVLPFPHIIDHYAVDALIGEGDIACVYSAVDILNGQRVALKRLRSDSPVKNARQYFDNEATILAQINHPTIPAFYERVTDEVLALKIVDGKDGETLPEEVPEGEFLATRRVIQWGIQIAGVLAYLHNRKPPIAFRDLKPAHIIVDENDTARLVDGRYFTV